MAIRAEAVEILVRKSRFEPEVAIGIAEAIEVSITLSQLVTIPVLDARLQELRHELKAETQALRGETQALRGEIHALRAEMRAEMRALATQLRGEFSSSLEKAKAELVRWVFLTMLGNVALSAFAAQVMKLFSN